MLQIIAPFLFHTKYFCWYFTVVVANHETFSSSVTGQKDVRVEKPKLVSLTETYSEGLHDVQTTLCSLLRPPTT